MRKRKFPKRTAIILLLLVVAGLPLILKQQLPFLAHPDDELVVMSPNTEFICDEFAYGFEQWYKKRTGRTIRVDFRHTAGTSETLRYFDTLYDHHFKRYWIDTLGRSWTYESINSFNKPIELPADPKDDTPSQAIRRFFLSSDVGCGVDVIFGSGATPFKILEQKGYLVPARIMEMHPEWFNDEHFPLMWAGDFLRHPQGLWFGSVFSTYGIVYNEDALKASGVCGLPNRWGDLTAPCYFGKVALCDPAQSGFAKKTFELMIQEQMQLEYARLVESGKDPLVAQTRAIHEGWMKGLALIQKLSANARYYTDRGTKPILDVAAGDCAAGPAFDCYGLGQAKNIAERGGSSRFGYITPAMGSALEADPIGILRGAPHREAAELFIEFVLSDEGQKLWAFNAGTPGGPVRYTLFRSPIIRSFYSNKEYLQWRSDPQINPYLHPEKFVYYPSWTMPIYGPLHVIIKANFIDPLPELQAAMHAIYRAQKEGRTQDAARALSVLEDFNGLDYDTVRGPFKTSLNAGDPLQSIEIQATMTRDAILRYKHAEMLANGS